MTEIYVGLDNPVEIDFDDFVTVTDKSRTAVREIRKRAAGFGEEDIKHFRELFSTYDGDKNGCIERKEMIRLIEDLHLPIENVEDQKIILEKFDAARAAARHCGIAEDEIGKMGEASIKFWPLVHMIRMFNKADDTVVMTREGDAIAEVKFAPKDVLDFREIFAYWSGIADDSRFSPEIGVAFTDEDATNSKRQKGLSTMEIVGRPKNGAEDSAAKTQWLSGDGVRRVLRCLGLKLTQELNANLFTKLQTFDLDNRGRLDFPDFLRLMKWMLSTNFADINNVSRQYAS